ncbi:HAD family hydrolase [Halospeciosus flavus]|uniref:HAD family hydrolase n=1 Tax=Halospeciosus flavus TaxID=3032283 RepID=A0ABD5Z975_9EURY|nr:HAD family hydrolase [Halospeciosus flavus]
MDAVLFDLDDTLVTYERGPGEVLDAAFADVGVDPLFSVDAYFERYAEFVEESDGIDDLRSRCFAAIAADEGHDPDLGRAVADAFAAERDHSRVRLCPGADEALDALAADHRLGLVTNGDAGMQAQKLVGAGLEDRFETVVYAGDETAAKPEREPFERALADLGVGADRAVHVGNSASSDVAGAHAAGLASVWVPDSADATPPEQAATWTLDSLHGLVDPAPPWR